MLSGKGVIAGSYTVHAHMGASGLDQFPADVHVVSTYAAPRPPVGVLFPSVK